ncbi:MBL fold metallo-hydrolase [Verrucomicrobiota bacterium]
MNIETIIVGEFQVNCYLVWGNSEQAIVIDPGAEAVKILAVLKKHNLSVAAYLLTHGHFDHICGLADLHEAIPAPIAMHHMDLKWAFNENNQMPPFYNIPNRPMKTDRLLEDGQELSDGGLSYNVISTPGHTQGSVCFYFPDHNCLFTGDTLFAGSIGRTDLQEGNPSQMEDSLKILTKMPDDISVYPGHGPASNMGHEKKTNLFMRDI